MNKDNNSFIRLFSSYAMIIIVPVILMGFLTICVLFRNLDTDTRELNTNIISQYTSILDTEINQNVSIFYQIEQSEKIQDFIDEQLYGYNISKYDLYDVLNELNILKVDSSLISKVGLYLKGSKTVVTDSAVSTFEEFHEILFDEEKFPMESFLESFGNTSLKGNFLVARNYEGEDIIVYYKCFNVKSYMSDVVVFAVWDKDYIISKVKPGNNGKEIEFALVDENNNIILKSYDFDIDPTKNKIIDGNNAIEVKSNSINCRYIYKLPKGGLSGNVGFISVVFILLMLFTAFISAIFAYWHMKKMKKLILGVFNENKDLQLSLSEQLGRVKERILSNILHNIKNENGNTSEKIEKYGVNFSKKSFVVMSVSNSREYNNELYSSVVENAWNEFNRILKIKIEEMKICCEILRTGRNMYSYILNFDEEEQLTLLNMALYEIKKEYSIDMSIGISNETDSIEKLYLSYEESVSALRFCLNERPGDTVSYKEIQDIEKTKIYYTSEKEKQLIRSIRTGSCEEVSEIMDEIYSVNLKERHISHSTFKRLVLNILFTVYKVLDEAYELDSQKHEQYSRECKNIAGNDNPEENFQLLRKICIYLCMDTDKKSGDDVLKERIVEYIGKNYSDTNLSLETLSEQLKISYYYLSRLFKEYFGTNFVSYLTNVRLEKAKELLKTKNCTISDIAEQTGFIGSNSLIRAFKKYYGTTPGEFRKK